MAGLRVAFMGTPDFSVPALEALAQSQHEIVAVYSQPPRPKGRGHQVQPSPVQARAEELSIPVFNPLSFKDDDVRAQFAAHNIDVAVVVAYGLILPQAALDIPKHGCLNIHASLLPRWRGASPIQQAIWAGDEQSGVAIMQMEKGLDTGPVIAQESVEITLHTTASALHDELCVLGGTMIVDVLDALAAKGAVQSTPQDDALTTYAPLLAKEDGCVNWDHRANSIDCQVRALNPWPGVYSTINDKRVKILEAARSAESSDAAAGTILDRKGHVACGDGTVLQLITVQPHGSRAMDFASAVNGGHLKVGEIFS